MKQTFQFTGKGDLNAFRDNWEKLERLDLGVLDDPRRYQVFDPDLLEAVNTALALGLPLLLTGEPGVGKTTLAARLAAELQCECLEFRVKSTTEGSDILYEVDHIRRMTDANVGDPRASEGHRYVRFNALGKAILRTWNFEQLNEYELLNAVVSATDVGAQEGYEPKPTVVLIDEIDKAPSDVPNDLLEEIRTLTFNIPHLRGDDTVFSLGGPLLNTSDAAKTASREAFDSRLRPVVIITSNSERALPQAFLRRCVYYNMTLPEAPGKLADNASDDDRRKYNQQKSRYSAFHESINNRVDVLLQLQRWGLDPASDAFQLTRQKAWDTFALLRAASLQRKPSTGELLSWLCAVHDPRKVEALRSDAGWISLACLLMVKLRDDLSPAQRSLQALIH